MMTGEHPAIVTAPKAVLACRLEMAGPSHPDRQALTAFIHAQFAHHYGADVKSFMPWLVGLYHGDDLSAAAGFRLARSERLYLEQYLDEPIESAIAHIPGLNVPRARIAEIGNLAGTVRQCVRELFVSLACLMQAAGIEVVTCTANPAVRAVFREMKMPFKPVCTAVPARLGRSVNQWGSYYDRTCIIMAVNVHDVINTMAHHYPEILGRAVPVAQAMIARELPGAHAHTTH